MLKFKRNIKTYNQLTIRICRLSQVDDIMLTGVSHIKSVTHHNYEQAV